MVCRRPIIRFSMCRDLSWPRAGAFFCVSRLGTRNSIWGPRGNSWKASDLLACMKPKSNSRKSSPVALGAFWVCALLASILVAGCRQDMHVQPRYEPEDPSTFFADGRSERPPVEGTVARGQLRTDELLYTGRVNGAVADIFPFAITATDLSRGRERYNIYCSPCHDYTGAGNGMIVQLRFPPAPSFHLERLRQAPAGHFFEVMSNGFGLMYSYASRVSPEDRWRIAAYIRALQLSQHGPAGDVPDFERPTLTGQPQ